MDRSAAGPPQDRFVRQEQRILRREQGAAASDAALRGVEILLTEKSHCDIL